jgi:hypothetical protein
LSHPQVVKDQAYIARELPHFLGDAGDTFELDDANGKAAQSGNVFGAMASAYAAAVFIIVPIDNVMAAVFDAPVAAIGGKNAFCVGLLRGPTGDAIGDFTGGYAGFFICGLPLDDESLANVGKVEIAVEFSCGPDFADFDSTVIGRVVVDEIGIFPVFKIKRDVFEKSRLVVLDGEVVMSVTFPDQIVGDIALGQEGIGGNIFTLDIDGIK